MPGGRPKRPASPTTLARERKRRQRQDEIQRQLERARDRMYHQQARADEEGREIERERDARAHQEARANEDKREIERERNTRAQQAARADEESRAIERERDARAHQEARADEERRKIERERDARAHHEARADDERRAIDRERNTRAQQAARADEGRRAIERERDARAHQEARADEERRQLENERRRVTQNEQRRTRAPTLSLKALDYPNDDLPSHSVGPMTIKCPFCDALLWHKEKRLCCHEGKVTLPPLTVPDRLRSIIEKNDRITKAYLTNIRSINSSLAFASMAAKMESLPGRGPYALRLQGEILHFFGGVHDPNLEKKYAQLYFLDSDEALHQRLSNPQNSGVDKSLMEAVQKIILEVSPFAATFKMMQDVEKVEEEKAKRENRPMYTVNVVFSTDPTTDKRRYNTPNATDIAVVFVSEDGQPPPVRDYAIHNQQTGLKLIKTTNPCRDPMVYVLLFPCGEKGWQPDLHHNELRRTQSRTAVTALQFYCYRLACREGFSLLHSSGKLFLQYIVDMYITVEGQRLQWIRENQQQLRVEQYQGLEDFVRLHAGQENLPPGKIVILPSTFLGSPRNMLQRFQDAMAIVAKFGKPDLFLTFTCNPKWEEITRELKPWESVEFRPDLVARVFSLKVKALMDDITKGEIFGKVLGFSVVIETQKRGNLHLHALFILDDPFKPREEETIDKMVSAEFPDPITHPRLHQVIKRFMVHGPCGIYNPTAVCMVDGKCSKGFPKTCTSRTVANVNGYPQYKREGTFKCSTLVGKKIIDIGNEWIVPYNPFLSHKYNAHINVEVCTSVKAVKYLYKYIYKGYDAATLEVKQGDTVSYDEVGRFIDTRYISSPEAVWRLLENPMNEISHTIIRLAVHLPMRHPVFFNRGEEGAALFRPQVQETMLTAWFQLNSVDPDARVIPYVEIPLHYTWNKSCKKWQPRKQGQGRTIGRLYAVSPQQLELFYLRMLLLHVRGATSFEALRTVDNTVHATFREAAIALNLLENDDEWEFCLQEASTFKMPRQLRHLFVTILYFCSPSNPFQLWQNFKEYLIEDFVLHHDREESVNLALQHIQQLLAEHGRSNAEFNLPVPFGNFRPAIADTLPPSFDDAAVVDAAEIAEANDALNTQQKEILSHVLASISKEEAAIFFIDGPGGTGKTFLYRCLISHLQALGHGLVSVAWTGIAARLLPIGKTAHSTFKLPVPLLDSSVSGIQPLSSDGEFMRNIKAIIWDEASMVEINALHVVDRMLRDVTQTNKQFGGKVVVFGGDFRQVLPVVRRGSRTAIVETCLKSYPSWPHFRIYHLTENMRAAGDADFSVWLLALGNGTLPTPPGCPEGSIEIPTQHIVAGDIVPSVFGSSMTAQQSMEKYDCVILSPKNDTCDDINSHIVVDVLVGAEKTYYSVDTLLADEDDGIRDNIPLEYLHSLTPAGLPPHALQLKVGAIVMIIRNLDPKRNLVNGVRLMVKQLHRHLIEATFLDSEDTVLIPRIDLSPADPTMPFKFKRRQFPVRLAFAMTINKAQGQTFRKVGLFLPQPVFGHGQLYVAFSRVRCASDICVKIIDDKKHQGRKGDTWYTKNVVYKEVL